MESSIAVFLMRWSACELLPTNTLSETATLHLLAFIHLGPRASVHRLQRLVGNTTRSAQVAWRRAAKACKRILAEGAIALSVTLGGGALFAS